MLRVCDPGAWNRWRTQVLAMRSVHDQRQQQADQYSNSVQQLAAPPMAVAMPQLAAFLKAWARNLHTMTGLDWREQCPEGQSSAAAMGADKSAWP